MDWHVRTIFTRGGKKRRTFTAVFEIPVCIRPRLGRDGERPRIKHRAKEEEREFSINSPGIHLFHDKETLTPRNAAPVQEIGSYFTRGPEIDQRTGREMIETTCHSRFFPPTDHEAHTFEFHRFIANAKANNSLLLISPAVSFLRPITRHEFPNAHNITDDRTSLIKKRLRFSLLSVTCQNVRDIKVQTFFSLLIRNEMN